MIIAAQSKLTPESLVCAPRRSPGLPNANGSHILYVLSKYDLETQDTTVEIQLMDTENGNVTVFSSDSSVQNAQWLGDSDDILYERPNDEAGTTELYLASAIHQTKTRCLGTIPALINELQATVLDDNSIGLAFCAPIDAQGRLHQPDKNEAAKATFREYNNFPIRIFDSWNPAYKSSLHFTVATKNENGDWQLGKFINALKHSQVEYPIAPTAVWGEGGSYTMNKYGIVIAAPLPGQNLAETWMFGIFTVALKTWQEDKVDVHQLKVPDYIRGSVDSPVISPHGHQIAFMARGESDGAGQSKVYIGYIATWGISADEGSNNELLTMDHSFQISEEPWDREPFNLIWGHNSDTVYLMAEDGGSTALFSIDSIRVFNPPRISPMPSRVFHGRGSVSSVSLLNRSNKQDPRLFVTASSFVESSQYIIINPIDSQIHEFHSLLSSCVDFGLSYEKQVLSIWYPGDQDHSVQAWIMLPSNFSASKMYPLLVLCHGGPEQAWSDDWSTRWNPALYAEQGYVVVMPNFAGSPGFGYEFGWSAENDYGGRPYRDIEKCYDWVAQNLTYVDISRACFAGASYGGYMAYWIQGQPLGKKFKAIVAHAGFFNFASMLSSDLISRWSHEGRLWENPEAFYKWSPSSYTANWSTPMLVTHGEKDFRSPLDQGVAAYGVCRARGIPARLITFLNEAHLILRSEDSLIWHRAILEWLHKYSDVNDNERVEGDQ